MNTPEAVLRYLEKRPVSLDKPLLCKIRWVEGGGILAISRLEWKMNSERQQRLDLIKCRIENLYRQVKDRVK